MYANIDNGKKVTAECQVYTQKTTIKESYSCTSNLITRLKVCM